MNMIAILVWAGSGAAVVFGLIYIQLQSMKKCHPNAELFIGTLKQLCSD